MPSNLASNGIVFVKVELKVDYEFRRRRTAEELRGESVGKGVHGECD